VSKATRERVLVCAEKLGYKADPNLSRMMHAVRGRKRPRSHATIAVVRDHVADDGLLGPAYQYVSLDDIKSRAYGYGYEVEEFWLGRDRLTAMRLQGILDARGIEAVIVSPQSLSLPCSSLDYSRLAAVAFGFAMRTPSLHSCSTSMNLGVQLAAAHLQKRGYRRIGLAVTQWIDNRSLNGYSGGWYQFQAGLPEAERLPILLLPHNDMSLNSSVFRDWFSANLPDAVISFDWKVPDWILDLGCSIPGDVGFVVHDWTKRTGEYAGIYHRRDHVAAAAVDLIHSQLLQHERGVPEVPRHVYFPAEWVDGPSIRAQILA
jgi:LacI family transcriptional regulator